MRGLWKGFQCDMLVTRPGGGTGGTERQIVMVLEMESTGVAEGMDVGVEGREESRMTTICC